MGSDLLALSTVFPQTPFQSTLPVWGATAGCIRRPAVPLISIHAPRVGSDQTPIKPLECPPTFQSTLPVWGATLTKTGTNMTFKFQSTLPVWGATTGVAALTKASVISIHAPRVGSDRFLIWSATIWRYFNPRSPCGERPASKLFEILLGLISIHAPRVGSDFLHFPFQFCAFIFQSTLPVWGATKEVLFLAGSYDISIHAPRVGSDGGKNIL